MSNIQENAVPTQTDSERKRKEFAKALFETLKPAVIQCDEVVRSVFQSQNKVLMELGNLEHFHLFFEELRFFKNLDSRNR